MSLSLFYPWETEVTLGLSEGTEQGDKPRWLESQTRHRAAAICMLPIIINKVNLVTNGLTSVTFLTQCLVTKANGYLVLL